MNRPWRSQETPGDLAQAKHLLNQRVPFNATRLAELADVVAPRRRPQPEPQRRQVMP